MIRLHTALAACLLTSSTLLQAQDTSSEKKPAQEGSSSRSAVSDHATPPDWTVHTYTLHNITQQNDANEILVALRNMLSPTVRLMLVTSSNVIVLYAGPDQQQIASRLIQDLDRPRQSYRLTYTLTETDAGKRVGIQHFSMVVVTGQRTTTKEGSKVPVLTGSYSTGSSSAQTQFQYVDVGMNFDASLDPYANGLRLRTKVEQSSSTEDKSISGITEPIIRQAVLEGVSILTPGKPVNLGSLEVPGTTRRIEIEVVADPMP